MFKNILISGLFCSLLSAESFDIFLQKAITNNPYLESITLAVDQKKELANSITRYENPSLEVEYSSFNQDTGDGDNGYRLSYSQPIRLWSIGDAKENLSQNIINNADALYRQKRAIFIRDISIGFTSYCEQKMLLTLKDEELNIAKTIYDISKARYESGTISRGLMLQAKIDYETIQISKQTLSLSTNQSYYELLEFAGINEEIELNTYHTFILTTKSDNVNNPNIEVLQSTQNKALSEAIVNSNSVEWIDVFAEYESEPEQKIARFGINFPLAIFNTKSQEKNIASLEASRTQLLIDNENKRLNIEMSRLTKERDTLKILLFKNKEILKSEIELLHMFQNGYKIANINLLQLQDIKNKVVLTKRSLIQINTALNQNAITTNYNQGLYND